jgi:peptidoglycan/LPS O-acetylase OafA/YrhL
MSKRSTALALRGFTPSTVLLDSLHFWDVSILSRLLAHKSLQFLGESSYAMYLLQIPVMTLALAQFKSHGFAPLDSFLMATVVLIFLSGLVYQWFERPMRARLRA